MMSIVCDNRIQRDTHRTESCRTTRFSPRPQTCHMLHRAQHANDLTRNQISFLAAGHIATYHGHVETLEVRP